MEVQVTDANFRTKEKGWRCGLLLLLRVKDGNKTRNIKRILSRNEFYNAFIREYFQRPSCYDCQFKCNRQGYYADLTIADFWRIGNKIPLKIKDYTKGISAVVINTEKGHRVFKNCAKDLEVVERTWEEFSTNGGLKSSYKPHNNEEALEYLQNHTWKETQKKYFPLSLRQKISICLWLILKEKNIRLFKRIIRK